MVAAKPLERAFHFLADIQRNGPDSFYCQDQPAYCDDALKAAQTLEALSRESWHKHPIFDPSREILTKEDQQAAELADAVNAILQFAENVVTKIGLDRFYEQDLAFQDNELWGLVERLRAEQWKLETWAHPDVMRYLSRLTRERLAARENESPEPTERAVTETAVGGAEAEQPAESETVMAQVLLTVQQAILHVEELCEHVCSQPRGNTEPFSLGEEYRRTGLEAARQDVVAKLREAMPFVVPPSGKTREQWTMEAIQAVDRLDACALSVLGFRHMAVTHGERDYQLEKVQIEQDKFDTAKPDVHCVQVDLETMRELFGTAGQDAKRPADVPAVDATAAIPAPLSSFAKPFRAAAPVGPNNERLDSMANVERHPSDFSVKELADTTAQPQEAAEALPDHGRVSGTKAAGGTAAGQGEPESADGGTRVGQDVAVSAAGTNDVGGTAAINNESSGNAGRPDGRTQSADAESRRGRNRDTVHVLKENLSYLCKCLDEAAENLCACTAEPLRRVTEKFQRAQSTWDMAALESVLGPTARLWVAEMLLEVELAVNCVKEGWATKQIDKARLEPAIDALRKRHIVLMLAEASPRPRRQAEHIKKEAKSIDDRVSAELLAAKGGRAGKATERDQMPAVINGKTGQPAERTAGAKVRWQVVASHLEELRLKGEPFTSQPDYAKRLKCSPSTVHKAIQKTPSLQEWAKLPTSSTLWMKSLDGVVLDSTPQEREADPTDILEEPDVDKALRYLLAQAGPEERARINAMSPADKRNLAESAYRDPDFMPSPLD